MFDFKTGQDCGRSFIRGFTLLEVLVSLANIATVLVSIMRLQGQTISMNETIRFYSAAPFLAQAKIAEIRMDPQSFIGSDSGDFGEDVPGYDWQIDVQDRVISLEDDTEIFLLDAEVIVRHSAWGLIYHLSQQMPGSTEGLGQ